MYLHGASKGHAAQPADGQKVLFCLTNEFVDNEFQSLTSWRQGVWIHAWSASLGYRPSLISLLSVELISRDNKGTIPPWTDPCVCVCHQQSGLLSALKTNWCPSASIQWFI